MPDKQTRLTNLHRAVTDERDAERVLSLTQKFCETDVASQAQTIDAKAEFFPELLKKAAEIGLQSLLFDDKGGLLLDRPMLTHETTEMICSYSGAVGHAISIGRLHSYLLMRYASRDLIDRWVPAVRKAEAFGAFGISEPQAGTDVRGMTTVAERRGGDYVLNGRKSWLGFAPVCSFAIVLAKVGSVARDAPTVALVVDMASKGVRAEPTAELSGIRGMPNGSLIFDDCVVPADHAMNCDGFLGMMDGLNMARIEVGSFACGLLRAALRLSVERAATREAFGGVIGDLQSIQTKLGWMATDYRAARELVLLASIRYAAGDGGDQDLTSMAKLFATEAARRHTDQAVQIFASSGVLAASEVLRLHRDSKITQIFDGTSEIHETMLGRRAVRQFQREGGLASPFVAQWA